MQDFALPCGTAVFSPCCASSSHVDGGYCNSSTQNRCIGGTCTICGVPGSVCCSDEVGTLSCFAGTLPCPSSGFCEDVEEPSSGSSGGASTSDSGTSDSSSGTASSSGSSSPSSPSASSSSSSSSSGSSTSTADSGGDGSRSSSAGAIDGAHLLP